MSSQPTIRTEPQPCPKCGKILDARTLAGVVGEETSAVVRDFTVCFYCAAIMVIEPSGKLRLMPSAEQKRLRKESLATWELLQKAARLIAVMKATRWN